MDKMIFSHFDSRRDFMHLNWPGESMLPESQAVKWCQPESNIVLDIHGDPLKAKLTVFSDGNHHMALLPCLQAFYDSNPEVGDIVYVTTPPGPIVAWLKAGALQLGNLTLSFMPHVFISPPHVLDLLHEQGFVRSQRLLARNQGSVLLIQHGNPKNIYGVKDLMRRDVRLFISNPDRESVSYRGYRKTLVGMAVQEAIAAQTFSETVFGRTLVPGQRIHHREAPEAVASARADAAVVYYHLALRYTRIFANTFEIIPLGGTVEKPEPSANNQTSEICMGLVGDGGQWGLPFLDFMESRVASDIYNDHGLRHAFDRANRTDPSADSR
jgi:molybdate-binding protein